MSDPPASAVPAGLTPSQAINSSSKNNSGNNKNTRNRRRQPRNKKQNADTANSNDNDSSNPKTDTAVDTVTKPPKKQQGGARRKKQPPKKKKQGEEESSAEKQDTKSNKRNPKSNKKKKNKCPWRTEIPKGSVDPITLEELTTLPYPPFALCATEPYEPVPIWPVPPSSSEKSKEKGGQSQKTESTTKTQEELDREHQQRIQEQWAGTRKQETSAEEDADASSKKPPAVIPSKRHYNLYDGRALAYYLVSQLQFIDPLNRRDLTRDELLSLDAYLQRHNLKGAKVTEAYDAKGITLSSAGAAAHTAQGRAEILQQTASQLLNALFGGGGVASVSQQPSVQDQYAASQRRQQNHHPHNRQAAAVQEYQGVFGSREEGIMIIDDDENIGMRGGGGADSFPPLGGGRASAGPLHANAREYVPTNPFPALPTPAAASTAASASAQADNSNKKKPAAKPSKTLSRITGAVKKTNPEEQQRQWEAREEARKRAIYSNLTFGSNPVANGSAMMTPSASSLPTAPATIGAAAITASEEQLQRNRAFAEALGVQPATMRQQQQINSGWARPTGGTIQLDEFGNELNAAIYPDALIVEARERMPLLLKVEKKWKAFLTDDKAASMPLNPMDRDARKFVHEYSDFWNLNTESFDREPKRYIHCVKLMETHTPHPLLSDVARNYRGPTVVLPKAPKASYEEHPAQQTSGQVTKSREMMASSQVVMSSDDDIKQTTERFAALAGGSNKASIRALSSSTERPKLALAKRTLPTELPPFEPPQKEDDFANWQEEEKIRRQKQEERARKKREAEERKRQALQAAFASDSEDDGDDASRGAASTGSDWGDEPQALFDGSDEDSD